MIEKDWLDDSSPFNMIDYLENKVCNRRRFRLFACACCRRVWNLLQRNAARRIVELAEDYADGEASEEELQATAAANDFVDMQDQLLGMAKAGTQLSACVLYAIYAARDLVLATIPTSQIVSETSRNAARDYVPTPQYNETTGRGTGYDEREIAEKTKLLRDIFGNPFQAVAFDPSWRTEHTVGVAAKMYDERDFDDMPILADALEDAGCDNPDILSHCREPGVHVRGCWVVDLILGKE